MKHSESVQNIGNQASPQRELTSKTDQNLSIKQWNPHQSAYSKKSGKKMFVRNPNGHIRSSQPMSNKKQLAALQRNTAGHDSLCTLGTQLPRPQPLHRPELLPPNETARSQLSHSQSQQPGSFAISTPQQLSSRGPSQ